MQRTRESICKIKLPKRQTLRGYCGVLLVQISVTLCAPADCLCCTGMRGKQRKQRMRKRDIKIKLPTRQKLRGYSLEHLWSEAVVLIQAVVPPARLGSPIPVVLEATQAALEATEDYEAVHLSNVDQNEDTVLMTNRRGENGFNCRTGHPSFATNRLWFSLIIEAGYCPCSIRLGSVSSLGWRTGTGGVCSNSGSRL